MNWKRAAKELRRRLLKESRIGDLYEIVIEAQRRDLKQAQDENLALRALVEMRSQP